MAAVTKGGKASAQLPTGEVRNFIQDGDQVKERGRGVADGRVSIGFGEAAGQVRPASKMRIDGDRSQSLALGKEGLSRAGFLLRGRSAVSLFGDANVGGTGAAHANARQRCQFRVRRSRVLPDLS